MPFLTSLNFLKEGQPWPPKSEVSRLQLYKDNRDIFENEHAKVYEEQFKRIERVIGNFQQVVSYPVIINFQKKISLKVADLLLGEAPKISAGDKESSEQKAVEQILENSDLINTVYECLIDVSRFGNGILNVNKDGEQGNIDVSQPCQWFPVVSENNIKRILYHVIAWRVEDEQNKEKKYLKVQIHEKGFYTEKLFIIDTCGNSGIIGETIGKQLEEQVFLTGLSDFAIIPVSNVVTSDRIYGMDDYTEIDSIVSELLVRVSQITRVLDKHAAPSVQGPPTCLEQDPATGEWKLKMSNFFPRMGTDDPPVEYITWDAQMDASFKKIELLINFLYTISEMGAAIFGDLTQKAGQIPSGSALRRLMVSALAKVNRIRMRLDPALKRAIKLCSELGGKNIMKLETVSITWQDGLPGDPKEESEIIQSRTGNKATMSKKRALQQYDGMTEAEAEAELELIGDDDTQQNPVFTPFAENNPEIPEEESEE